MNVKEERQLTEERPKEIKIKDKEKEAVTEETNKCTPIIRKARSLCDGVYVKGKVEGVDMIFTADTGASRTVVSSRVYDKIEKANRPILKRSTCLIGANGSPIKERGKAVFQLKLGTYQMDIEARVADIEDDALLGYDVLKGRNEKGADILLSKNKIVMDGVAIPCFQVGEKQQYARKVTVAEELIVPGQTEAIINVFVERQENDDKEKVLDYLLEPTEQFQERYQLKMASTLVDINMGTTCKVRVLNPFSQDIILRQDAEIAKAERIDKIVTVVAEEETEEETGNNQSIRRLSTLKKTEVKPTFTTAKEEDIPLHLKPLYEKSTKGKSSHEKEVVAGLLVKYSKTFSSDEWDIGLTNLAEHPINTGDAYPIKQRPRRVPLAHADEERKAIEDLLKKGVIQKSTSPWASPIVLVKKKSGAIRPCVDYRKVNNLVKPDGFPLPRIQDCLDAVAGSCLFSSFDLTSGYFQIPLKKEDIQKSAFCCKYGQFEMTRMPFGLNNAASTFQRTMELALQGLQWITCLVYIDDIIVYASTFEQHIERVEEVLQRIEKAGLKLKPEKCNMLQTRVVFLGHVVSAEGVSPDPSNTAKVQQWPKPQNAKQVKQFVATGSYYRRFVKDFAKIAKPLTELTTKDAVFKWSSDCEDAFETIKKELTSPNVMGYPLNDGGVFLLDVDASGTGIGAVLSQIQQERERVIAYASRAMSKAERNYCITEKELLAVVFFIQYFRQYLLGRRFIVRSDHQALVWLFSLKEPSGKIARWIEILAQYDFEIQYRPGKKQGHCDALSRCENPRDCTCEDVDMFEPLRCEPCNKCRRRAEMMVLDYKGKDTDGTEISMSNERKQDEDMQTSKSIRAVTEPVAGTSKVEDVKVQVKSWLWMHTPESISRMQTDDPDIAVIIKAKQEDRKPSSSQMVTKSQTTRHYWVIWDSLRLRNGVLMKSYRKLNGTDEYMQLIVPRSIKQDVMHQMHNTIISGHVGTKKTKEKCLQRYYWYNLKEDVNLYIKRCDICEADKIPHQKPKAPLGHLRSGAPWDTLAIDYMGSFPVSTRGNKYILVLTDHYTKYVEVLATPNQLAEDCASRIVNDFISRWGTPLTIHSDQGSTFESRVFKELCSMLEMRKSRTSPRNPKGNGQTERFNRTLLKMIKAYIVDEQDEWDLHLGCLAGAYRSTPNESTKLTPNLLSIGREIRLPADVVFNCPSTEGIPTYGDHVERLKRKMLRAHDIARQYLNSSAKRNKQIYDTKQLLHEYHKGDVVWFLHETRKVGITPKLEKKYDGPFIVTEKMSAVNYKIQINSNGQEKLIHHDKIKHYEGVNIPKWILKVKKNIK